MRAMKWVSVGFVVSVWLVGCAADPAYGGGIHEGDGTDGGSQGPGDGSDAGAPRTATGKDGLTGGCNAMTCGSGCCVGDYCVAPSDQNSNACGGGGNACSMCPRGTACAGGRGCQERFAACSATNDESGSVVDTCPNGAWCHCSTEDGRCTNGTCDSVVGPVADDIRQTYRVRVLSAMASATNVDGDSFDADGSDPDLYVRVRYSPLGFGTFADTTAGSTSVQSDTTRATWSPAESFNVVLSYRESFYLELFDEDFGPDDKLFTCFVAAPLGPMLRVRELYRSRRIVCDSTEGEGSIVAEIHPT